MSYYNINSANLLQYYPFDVDYLDYASGTGVNNMVSFTSASIQSGTTILTRGSLYLPGNQSETVQTPNVQFTTNGITFALWMKPAVGIPTNLHRLFDFGYGAGGGNVLLGFYPSGQLVCSVFTPSSGSPPGTNFYTGFTLTDTNWHHYCLTFTSSAAGSPYCNLYVDGVLQSMNVNVYPNLSILTSCLIGKSNWPGDVSSWGSINAYFNQFLCFNRTLTSTEIGYLASYPLQVQLSQSPSGLTNLPCFLQGSKILAFQKGKEKYVPVEKLKTGDLIKTSKSGYKAISIIGHKHFINVPSSKNPNRLFVYRKGSIPELEDDLIITGEHCALLSHWSKEKRESVVDHMGDIYVTEDMYRIPAHLDDRASPYGKPGSAHIWHFALENDDIKANYGVYANGLLVESSSIRYMKEVSGMELL